MTRLFDLSGRLAVVVGGTSGIGRAIALGLADAGADVVVTGRRAANVEAVAAEIEGRGRRTLRVPADVAQTPELERVRDACLETFGRLDIMVLNSGGVRQTAPVAQMSDEEWRFEVDWNLNHVFWGMRRSLQHMIPRQSGRIIVTSSVEGKLGKPGIPGYVACKHAVNGLVKGAAHEVGTLGITVNALLPGIIETDIVVATGPDSAVAMGVGTYDKMIELFTAESAIKRPESSMRGPPSSSSTPRTGTRTR